MCGKSTKVSWHNKSCMQSNSDELDLSYKEKNNEVMKEVIMKYRQIMNAG